MEYLLEKEWYRLRSFRLAGCQASSGHQKADTQNVGNTIGPQVKEISLEYTAVVQMWQGLDGEDQKDIDTKQGGELYDGVVGTVKASFRPARMISLLDSRLRTNSSCTLVFFSSKMKVAMHWPGGRSVSPIS